MNGLRGIDIDGSPVVHCYTDLSSLLSHSNTNPLTISPWLFSTDTLRLAHLDRNLNGTIYQRPASKR